MHLNRIYDKQKDDRTIQKLWMEAKSPGKLLKVV